ncbi:NAD dependent epimerase/dehydratase [Boeremia exigua]|uniref:NAD dependent epimerase/dehydratase n=1 Tax=Boeremia exigua TaxID=749465 RepID=UPI001E8D642D|nr:NAD dependent epimerase/dehydratase [Boeremia exigua]KAH6612576.1 NAD dependent epimerase/dehydratase [Boeremia exigua]
MSQSLIFITGATGFIGSHVVSQALAAGYKVRLSVRKEAQIAPLRKQFSKNEAQLEFVNIADFTSPNAFAEALQDVTYVFHLASPMPGKGTDFEKDYVEPAVQGTISLLDAAKKFDTIKRVVIVSSVLALIPLDALATGQFVAKEGLNESIAVDLKMSFPDDPMASGGIKYHASKVLAHRATLAWAASNTSSFQIITLHPSFVFGRNLTQTSAAALDGTNAMLWISLTSAKPIIPMAAVDVRDVAGAHIKALNVQVGAKGEVEEFILSAGEKDGWTWSRVAEFAKEKYPSVGVQLEGPFGEPPKVDTQRAQEVLGVKWRTMEDTIGSFLDQQAELRSQL